MNIETWQWILVIGSSLALFVLSPYARDASQFFRGSKENKQTGTLALMSSLVISWLFAKSITNAANLGLGFGLIGGVAYAAYYLSFAVAGVVIYRMRKYGGFRSIHHFLESRYGKGAVLLFSLLICVRLFNEVWSNTMVIGSYFGDIGSWPYYAAILVFTALTLAYCLKGGMSSSILTDVIQMALFGVLLIVVLGAILPRTDYSVTPFLESGEWTLAAGGNLLLVAILQSFSYPFHDPVLTDRGFISDPKTTLRAFLLATPLGFACILLFSFVGIFGQFEGLTGQAPVEVAKLLGGVVLLVMNFIMITSAASTLDSTFTSFSKLVVIDLLGKTDHGTAKEHTNLQIYDTYVVGNTVSFGRIAMVIITVLGTLPVFADPAILSATTVSGAMVVGLAPVFCLWATKAPQLSFYGAVLGGIFFGTIYVMGVWPDGLTFTSGPYADLLGVTVYSLVACFALFLLPYWLLPKPK